MTGTEGETRHYCADQSASYVLAIILLMEYARGHKGEEFAWYPLDAVAMRDGGLFVSGPDLAGPAAVLAGVPGLVEDKAGQEDALARLAVRGRLGGARGG